MVELEKIRSISFEDRRSISKEIFTSIQLPDRRLDKRLIKCYSQLLNFPGTSFSQAFSDIYQSKAWYRFIDNERVTGKKISQHLFTHGAEISMRNRTIYAVSDTTEISFPATQIREEYGHGSKRNKITKGLFVHTTISVTETGIPIGLLHQKIWTRDPETRGKKHRRKQLPIEEKESYKWIEAAEGTMKAFSDCKQNPQIVMIGDRENDIHEYFQYLHDHQLDGIIRSSQNRKIDGPVQRAWDAVAETSVAKSVTTEIPRKINQKARKASLEIRYLTGAVLHPIVMKGRNRIPINIIMVTEKAADPEKETENKINWKIYTTLDIQSGEDAWGIVQKYRYRWRVEEFHFVLKSGCRIEKLQFETFKRYEKALMILSQVAIVLLRLKYLSRVTPDLPASEILSELELFILKTKAQQLIRAGPPEKITIEYAMGIIGRMGGHSGRKSDGPPGVKTLWQGWRDLQTIVDFMRAMNTDASE